MKMMILNGDLMRAAEAVFSRFSSWKFLPNFWSILRKITTMRSDLSKIVHIYRWGDCGLRAELYNMMKLTLEGSNLWQGSHKTAYDEFASIGTQSLEHLTLVTLGCSDFYRWQTTEIGTSYMFVKAIKLWRNRFLSD